MAKNKNQVGYHPGLEYIKSQVKKSFKILDVGCNDGRVLESLLPKEISGWGIDVAKKAITRAQRQYPRHHFLVVDAVKLPFPENEFDIVCSVYSIEHVSDPEKVIREMIRVCKIGGQIIIIAPNFGSPTQRSLPKGENRIISLIKDFIKDWNLTSSALNWQIFPFEDSKIVEPYLLSLRKFLPYRLGMEVLTYSSLWYIEKKPNKFIKRFIWWLGNHNFYPFNYWGPELFLAAKKVK